MTFWNADAISATASRVISPRNVFWETLEVAAMTGGGRGGMGGPHEEGGVAAMVGETELSWLSRVRAVFRFRSRGRSRGCQNSLAVT
jgi:hypothetical protein